jgi:hypothetical protein
VQRVLGDQQFELVVDAGRADLEAALDAVEAQLDPEGLQTLAFGEYEGKVGQVFQRVAAPAVECGGGRGVDVGPAVRTAGCFQFGDSALDLGEVGGGGVEPEPGGCSVQGRALFAQSAAEAGGEDAQAGRRAGELLVAPEIADEDLVGDRVTASQGEADGQRPHEGLSYDDAGGALHCDLNRPENPELQSVITSVHCSHHLAGPPSEDPPTAGAGQSGMIASSSSRDAARRSRAVKAQSHAEVLLGWRPPRNRSGDARWMLWATTPSTPERCARGWSYA